MSVQTVEAHHDNAPGLRPLTSRPVAQAMVDETERKQQCRQQCQTQQHDSPDAAGHGQAGTRAYVRLDRLASRRHNGRGDEPGPDPRPIARGAPHVLPHIV